MASQKEIVEMSLAVPFVTVVSLLTSPFTLRARRPGTAFGVRTRLSRRACVRRGEVYELRVNLS
jgi:hypothetical protein